MMEIDINKFHKLISDKCRSSSAYGDVISIKSLLEVLSVTLREGEETPLDKN